MSHCLKDCLTVFQSDCTMLRSHQGCMKFQLLHVYREILRENLNKSSMYGALDDIEGIGPRYCPSIEDKVVRFSDKERHQLFIEPESRYYDDMYLQGFSTSMPPEIQELMVHSLPGFEHAKILKYGYAIEYDAIYPTQLKASLETKILENLFTAGQINGTSGYEEAACQGLMAGINASLKLEGKEPLILKRNEAYIGVLIDDLITKGVDEPYRMFTSRAEFRILLRQDDADMRLTQKGYNIGLATQERYDRMCHKRACIDAIIAFANDFSVKAALINDALTTLGTAPLQRGCKLEELLGRPQLSITNLQPYIRPFANEIDRICKGMTQAERDEIVEAAEIQIKYKGYIMRERQMAEKMVRLENIKIAGKFDYMNLNSITIEARQKLTAINPETLAQASRIPGVSPSDINVLLVLLGR